MMHCLWSVSYLLLMVSAETAVVVVVVAMKIHLKLHRYHASELFAAYRPSMFSQQLLHSLYQLPKTIHRCQSDLLGLRWMY